MAKVFGYQRTSISHLNVFYDKENEQYLKWNNEAQTWNNTKITDVSPNGNFISDGKAYRALQSSKKEISKKEFFDNLIDVTSTDLSKPITEKQSKPTNIMIHTTEDVRQIIGEDLYM